MFTPYKLLIECVVIGSLFAALALGIHRFLEHERDIGRNEVRAEYELKLKEAKEDARLKEQNWNEQLTKAQNTGVSREIVIRDLAASASKSSIGLRDAITGISNSVPNASINALRESTTTLSTLLTDCQGRYRELAEKADRHANDVKTLTEAYPQQ